MTSGSSLKGCELPEAARLQYLDAMGITCWQQQHVEALVEDQLAHAEQAVPDDQPAATGTQAVPISQHDWRTLQQEIAACTRCDPLVANRHLTVFGAGDQRADLLIIGDAPGADEDAQGEPFMGPAGQLLNAMLKAIGLERERVYLTNIIKCRPPSDRQASPQETSACSPYLQRQVALIKPKVILAVGSVAAQQLLDSQQALGQLRGRQHDYNGTPVLVTYHPSDLLRQPSDKRNSWQDLLQLKQML